MTRYDSDSDDSEDEDRSWVRQWTRGQGTIQTRSVLAPIRTVRIGSFAVSGTKDEVKCELDSHADTCVVGEDTALVIQDFGRQVAVHGYDEDIGQVSNCRTVSAVVAYDHPETGDVYMLVLHQAILLPKMKSNLLCPMQMRDNDIRVNDEPKHMALNPTDEDHAITIQGLQDKEALQIPLSIRGVISYFPSRKPTRQEWEASDLSRQLELTAEAPEWDPTTSHFEEQENNMLEPNGKLRDKPIGWSTERVVAAMHSIPQHEPIDYHFGQALKQAVRVVSSVQARRIDSRSAMKAVPIKAVKSSAKTYPITAKQLTRNWGISLKRAEATIEATTQHGVRTLLHPTLSRRFRTNDRQLRYRRLSHEMFTDTLESRVVSWKRQNRYAQVFATRFGWVRVYPMKRKSEAHEGLSLLAQRDGVPPVLIMDGSKEQTKGEFSRKARQMGIRIKQTEPYSPWQNAAEGAIREVKRGAGRKMATTRSPAKLWDHCLELEAMIRSSTALDIYELHGQTPETIVSGQTNDISPYVECRWYDWVMWYSTLAKYPEPKEVLGRWLGPALDVGPAMTSKILKRNGEILFLSSYRKLTDDEMQDPDLKKDRDAFDEEIRKRLGRPLTQEDLKEIDVDAPTPEYELYEDDFEGTTEKVQDIDEVTPEDQDNYVGAQVNLSFGGTIRSGKVKRRATDAEGKVSGLANPNPILDTRLYEVEFPDGDVAEYSANVIAENMYAQCDPNGNQFLLMEAIVDHKTDGTAVKFADVRNCW